MYRRERGDSANATAVDLPRDKTEDVDSDSSSLSGLSSDDDEPNFDERLMVRRAHVRSLGRNLDY